MTTPQAEKRGSAIPLFVLDAKLSLEKLLVLKDQQFGAITFAHRCESVYSVGGFRPYFLATSVWA